MRTTTQCDVRRYLPSTESLAQTPFTVDLSDLGNLIEHATTLKVLRKREIKAARYC